MDGEDREEQLARRVARLERRVRRLEDRIEASETAPPARAVPLGPPAPPAAAIMPRSSQPAVPMGPTSGDVVGRWLAGADDTRGRADEGTAPQPRRESPALAPVPAHPAALWAASSSSIPDGLEAPEASPRAFDLRELEERFAGRALAWIGGLALVAAAIFFLSLAFSRGWITEEMRVVIGLVAGSAALGIGALLFDRRNPLLGNVLTAVGLGIVSIALFAATRGYSLVPAELGLLGALAAAVAAAAIAVRYDAREVAVFGLVAALIAPPVMGASPTLLTLLFIAVTLVGTTAIALFRSWRWLPSIAFILAAPQLADWIVGGADTVQALVALAGFWLVNTIAAGGEELRIRRDDLRPSSATLVLANGAFLVWGGYAVLTGDAHVWLGTFIALAALAHVAVGSGYLYRQGLQHLFGNLVAGTGAALLALAAFVQLGAALVPVAWSAEAAALAWLAARRTHVWSALAAAALGAAALAHVVVVEYPLDRAALDAKPLFATPWLHPEAASLAALLVAMAVAGWFARAVPVRSALAAIGALVLGYAAMFEADGPVLIALLVLVALAATELDHWIAVGGTRDDLRVLDTWSPFRWYGTAAGAVLGALAVLAFIGVEAPPARLAEAVPATPYVDRLAVSLAIMLAGLLAAGIRLGTRGIRSGLAGIGVLLVAWSVPLELDGTARIAMLAVLLPLAVVGDRLIARSRDARRFAFLALPGEAGALASAAGGISWLAGLAVAVASPLDPGRWGSVTPPPIPFSDETALVAVLLAGTAVAAAAWAVSAAARELLMLGALVPVALVVPLEVYADGVVVLWLLLAAAAFAVTRPDSLVRAGSYGLALALGAGAYLVAFGIVAPPDRMWVDPTGPARPALLTGWWAALAATAAAPVAASRRLAEQQYRPWLEVLAAALGVYLVSVGVVEPFSRLVGGTIPTEELATQAQVALSVAWTAIGAVALGVGLRLRRTMPRHIGLGLLALATAKVFVVDLAAMDVAYRALVLAGLGVLLLASAWLFTHPRGPRPGTPGLSGPRPAG